MQFIHEINEFVKWNRTIISFFHIEIHDIFYDIIEIEFVFIIKDKRTIFARKQFVVNAILMSYER